MEILKGKFSPSDLIKNRKPKVQNKECVICSGCGKFLMKDNMYKHRKTCSAISSDGSYVEGISPYVLSAVDSNFSDSYKTSVLERFHRNDVGKQIQEDDWIKMFGYLHFQGTERSINRIEKRKYIMARMRRLAKLFIIFKKVTAGKDVDTSSSVLMFCRENIEYLLKAVGIMTAADDEGQTIRRKFNILMKSSINDVCRQLEEYYLAKLTKEDDLRKEELKNFTSLLNRKWTKYFSAAEEEDLSEENSDSELNEPEKSPQSFIQHSEPEKSPQSCIQHSEPEKSPQSCIQHSEPEKSPQSFIQQSEPEKSPQSCIQHKLSESLNASSIQHYIATEFSTGEEVPNDEGQLMIKHFRQPEIMNKNVNQSPRGVREIMCVDAHLSSLDNTKGKIIEEYIPTMICLRGLKIM
ncbi:hypothetical protein FSP39_010443 [Pinctada imbricata]|uniref:Uncharacterized protein n=1 Tax=Pinctada imbricata TaxID=66713 RepID=A0AA88YQP4_PINIB|nr:hypothetical protein FSP39_010443 [Pinctada imbricata]